MQALIITGGAGPNAPILRRLAQNADLIIAADSGLDAAQEANIEPDLIVGDFDSLRDPASLLLYEKKHIIQYPVDKDATDTEIALSLACEKGADRIILAGGAGGRLDHLIGLLWLFRKEPWPDEWHTDAESVFRLEKGSNACYSLEKGAIVSIFPLLYSSEGMYSEALKWPLAGLVWKPGDCGISNVALSEKIQVGAGNTALLVVLPLGAQCIIPPSVPPAPVAPAEKATMLLSENDGHKGRCEEPT